MEATALLPQLQEETILVSLLNVNTSVSFYVCHDCIAKQNQYISNYFLLISHEKSTMADFLYHYIYGYVIGRTYSF